MSLRSEAGFSVIELLIALAIIALTTTTLVSALEFTRRLSVPVETRRDNLEEIVLLHRLLTEALAQVIVSKGEILDLAGSDSTLSVLTRAPRLLPFLTAPVRLSLQPDRDGKGLWASWNTELSGGKPLTHRLVRPDQRVRFAYFAPEADWSRSWSGHSRIPALVRVRLGHGSANNFDIVVPVQAIEHPLCAVQARNHVCR